MKVGRWSTVAGNNNAAPPDGAPEGQAPSTLNDCIRENMAALRVAFNDLQYFDQALTPTQINATSFSVPGNQTSAIHAGRRLKLNDANTIYGTVSTASFTTVTTINVETDGGLTLTSSLSSFGLSVLSNQNDALPRWANVSLSAVNAATLSVSATATFAGPIHAHSTLSVSGTTTGPNIAKAWGEFTNVTGFAPAILASHNIASISRSALGVYRITFANAMADANYAAHITVRPFTGAATAAVIICYDTITAGSIKFQTRTSNSITADWNNCRMSASFWHL